MEWPRWYIYIYIYSIRKHICIYTYTYHTCTYLHKHAHIYVSTHIFYICIFLCIYKCTCIDVCTCIYIYVAILGCGLCWATNTCLKSAPQPFNTVNLVPSWLSRISDAICGVPHRWEFETMFATGRQNSQKSAPQPFHTVNLVESWLSRISACHRREFQIVVAAGRPAPTIPVGKGT